VLREMAQRDFFMRGPVHDAEAAWVSRSFRKHLLHSASL